eukprot:g28161.t1
MREDLRLLDDTVLPCEQRFVIKDETRSFLSGLFGWTFAGEGQAVASSDSSKQYSFERLQQLYNGLAQFQKSDLEKSGEGDKLIETVRQITEVLIWGEQTNNSQFFDFFCEKSIFSDLVHVLGLKKASKKVKLQLLQTLSMLVQNIRRQTSCIQYKITPRIQG